MKVLSILSGGLDSVCWTADHMDENEIVAITFDYGQKNHYELDIARALCREFVIPHYIIDLSGLKFIWSNLQLTDHGTGVAGSYRTDVIVPLRNAVFLSIAMSKAYHDKMDVVLIGSEAGDMQTFVHGDHDEYHFPDCSPLFLQLMERACSRGVFKCINPVRIDAPSKHNITKSDLIKIGYDAIGEWIYTTWSCYANAHPPHCGRCLACINRASAFLKAGIKDKTEYELR